MNLFVISGRDQNKASGIGLYELTRHANKLNLSRFDSGQKT